MASESSSAVLDLQDDDEDVNVMAVSLDNDAQPPLIMDHGYDIAVKVDAPIKQLSTLETFVTYRVRCVCARWATPPGVRRRYNHFKELHRRLAAAHPLIAPPPAPPLHSARQQLDRYSQTFVAIRTVALDAFLNRIAKHPILTHSEDFRIFLTTPDEELDKVFKSENSAMNLWGLSSALYNSSSGGETKQNANGPRVKDPEFSSAAEYLLSLEQKLTTLCSLTTKLFKGSTGLATEYTNLKRTCDAWSSSERGAVAAGCGALSLGGRAAGGARSGRAASTLRTRAVLPLSAAHARDLAQCVRNRDRQHAAYVAGNNSEELHNRLEQATEALRAELTDWNAKTRAELKSILLELAENQVSIHQQTSLGWEHALRSCAQLDVTDLFKTVSRTAVQNLSPTRSLAVQKSQAQDLTERDVDDLDVESGDDVQELNSDEVSRLDATVTSDPLKDFADVDLSAQS